MDSVVIELTAAAQKHGNLNIRPCGKDFFPQDVFGGSSRRAGLGNPITLNVAGLPAPITTDIPTDRATGRPRWMFRERTWVKAFIRHHGLAPHGRVLISKLRGRTYSLSPVSSENPNNLEIVSTEVTPSALAQQLAQRYVRASVREYRKEHGQFFTPPDVAAFMASLATQHGYRPTRILDPGAGMGSLTCAVCEALAGRRGVSRLEVDLFENDAHLIPLLHECLTYLEQWLVRRGVFPQFNVIEEDFVLSINSLYSAPNQGDYDLVVCNPPYQKIAGDDARALSMTEAVYGQPNLYALFMAASMNRLRQSGLMVFITPRSYASGHYFKAFRGIFFGQMKPVSIHVFGSRKDVFSSQSVLQENIILKAVRGKGPREVTISGCKDLNDLPNCEETRVGVEHVIWHRNGEIFLRLPLDELDREVLELVDSWTGCLNEYGLQISTGPVVPFRNRQFISSMTHPGRRDTAPLLWMRNVLPMQVIWPLDGAGSRDSSNQYIVDSAQTRRHRLVIPLRNMVLLRRFSTKDEKRRLTAAPLLREEMDHPFVGLENHLNYIYSIEHELSRAEACGLAEILNSSLLDRYFRITNGNTQVGAVEIRATPLPPLDTIREIGLKLAHLTHQPSLREIDDCVSEVVRGPLRGVHGEELATCDV